MGNTVLYRMVRDYPDHKDPAIVQDKMLIIGRVYSASVTRGGGSKGEESESKADGLYHHLAQAVVEKGDELDQMIEQCRSIERVSFENLETVAKVHQFLNGIIVASIKGWRGSGGEGVRGVHGRISFVSKYLHFHAPMAFFILDSIVVETLKFLRMPRSRAKWPVGFLADLRTGYATHVWHMLNCSDEHYSSLDWTPRLIDGHLLGYINAPAAPEAIQNAKSEKAEKTKQVAESEAKAQKALEALESSKAKSEGGL